MGAFEAFEEGVPVGFAQAVKVLGEAGDDFAFAQHPEAIGRGGAVEEAEEAEHGEGLGLALRGGEPVVVAAQHFPRGAMPLGAGEVVGFVESDLVDAADVAAVGIDEETPEQGEAEGVAAEVLGGFFQLLNAAGDGELLQQAHGDGFGQFV